MAVKLGVRLVAVAVVATDSVVAGEPLTVVPHGPKKGVELKGFQVGDSVASKPVK
jgi:hypothetical protein